MRQRGPSFQRVQYDLCKSRNSLVIRRVMRSFQFTQGFLTDTVHIIFHVIWEVKVDHNLDVIHVKPTRRNISRWYDKQ